MNDAPARDELGNPITQQRWEAVLVQLEEACAAARNVVPYAVPRIRKWFRGSPCAIVIEFAGDITNAQVEALPRALMDALASDRQVLHSYNAHCAYCEWSREDVDGLAEGKKLAAEHAKTCKWHPMNVPRVEGRS